MVVVLLVLGLILAGCAKYKTVTKEETIPYKTITKENPERWEGEKTTIQSGEPGIKIVYWREKYTDDKVESKEKVDEKITKKPIDEIVEVGTKKKATGYKWTISTNLPRNVFFEITIRDIRRVFTGEIDYLDITYHVKNLKDEFISDFDFIRLAKGSVENGKFIPDPKANFPLEIGPRYLYLNPIGGFSEDNNILGGGEKDITFTYILKQGSVIPNKEVASASDLYLYVGVGGKFAVADESSETYIPLTTFWQGPFN